MIVPHCFLAIDYSCVTDGLLAALTDRHQSGFNQGNFLIAGKLQSVAPHALHAWKSSPCSGSGLIAMMHALHADPAATSIAPLHG
jgi:hypothetical protein